LIHFCRHSWWTNFMLPSQRQGAMRGESSSISHTSHWQIRQQSCPDDSMDRLVSHLSEILGVGEFRWWVSCNLWTNYCVKLATEINHHELNIPYVFLKSFLHSNHFNLKNPYHGMSVYRNLKRITITM
jgi:hypothetical protein